MTRRNKYRILGLLCLLYCSCMERQKPYALSEQEAAALRAGAGLQNDSIWSPDSGRLLSPDYHVPRQSQPVPIMFYINEGEGLYDSITLDN